MTNKIMTHKSDLLYTVLYIFRVTKFISALLLFPLLDFIPEYGNIILYVNMLETIPVELYGGTYINMIIGLLLIISFNTIIYMTLIFKNDGLIYWLSAYFIWNVRFCKCYFTLNGGIIHNIIPYIITLLLMFKYDDPVILSIKWGQMRGISIATYAITY